MGVCEGNVLETDKTSLNPFDQKGTVKVMIAQPSAGIIDCLVMDNRMDLAMEIARLEYRSNYKFFSALVARNLINHSREQMCAGAIETGMDYLLMIDDDQIVPPTMPERLLKVMLEKNADIVAPMVTQRLYPYNPVMYRHVAKPEFGPDVISNEFIHDFEPNSVVKVDGIGFGVVLIKIEMVKKLPQPWFFSNTQTGEDIHFCIRARKEQDAKIFVDTSIKTGHLRPPEMATEYDWVKAKGLEEKYKGIYGHIKSKEQLVNQFVELAGKK